MRRQKRRVCLGVLLLTSLFFAGAPRVAVPAESAPAAQRPPQAGTSLPGRVVQPRELSVVEAPSRPVPLGTEADLPFWKGREAPGPPLELIEDRPRRQDPAQPLTPALPTNFAGIPATGWYPPDTILAAGPSHVIEMVNSSLRISSKTGTNLLTTTLASWWSPADLGPFDPKIAYDQHSGRWIMLALARNTSPDESWYFLSTSKSSDPTGNWCTWALDADVDGSTPSTNWADFPALGVDDQAIYITSNQFSFSGNTFQYAKLRILGKTQLYDNTCDPVPWWDFWGMTNADTTLAFTLQPALTFGTPGKEYLVNSRSGAGSSVTLWSVTNPLGTPPTLTREATVSVGAYSAPPDAEQLGSGIRIDTGDARLLNAVYRDGSLYTGHTVTCFTSYSCIRYLRLDVSSPAATLDAAVGAAGSYYYYPAMMPDAAGNILTVFSRSSSSEYAGVRYASWRASDSSFQPSDSLKAGEAAYAQVDTLGRNRWGDYSGIALDPSDSTLVWIAGEFAGTPANTWGTWIGAITEASDAPPGTFTGKVKNAAKQAVADATIGAYQSAVLMFSTTSNASGVYSLPVDAGTYDLVASKPADGYLDTTKPGLTIASGQTLTKIKFKLFRPSFFQGTVTQKGTTTPLEGALVEALKNSSVVASDTTAADGTYSLQVIKGTYTLRASLTGFKTKQKLDQAIGDGVTKTLNLALPVVAAPPAANVDMDVDAGNPTGFAFVPLEVTVNANESVRWINVSGAPHTIVWDSLNSPPDSGTVNDGQSTTVVMPNAGTFLYHCGIHGPLMNGSVTVNP